MAKLEYLEGDATYPIGDGLKIIPHVCNDINRWGSGFVLALNKRWPEPKARYHQQFFGDLGDVEFVTVENDIVVANMVGQEGVIDDDNELPPIRYKALITTLEKVSNFCNMKEEKVSVHMPQIGSGLAGGDWNLIEHIVKNTLVEKGIDVYVYVYTG